MNRDPNWDQDLELVRLVRAGDCDAVDTFVQRLRLIPRVLSQRNNQLGRPFQPAELDDMAQEVFSRVWTRLEDFRGDANFDSWVYRFCCWTMLDELRKRRPLAPLSAAAEEPNDEDTEREPGEALDDLQVIAAVEALPPDEGRVVILKQLEGRSFEEVGRRLEISPNTAKTRYYRALERLRNALASSFGEDLA